MSSAGSPPPPGSFSDDVRDEPGGHVGVERLSDLADGLLAEPERRAVTAHLTACARCRATSDHLATDVAELRVRLGALAAPGPMPAAVAARIDSALAAASTAPRAQPAVTLLPTPALERSATRRPTRPRWSTRRVLLPVAAAAAAVVMAAGIVGGGLNLPVLQGGDDAGDTAESAGGAGGAGADLRVGASGRDYSAATIGADARALLGGQAAPDNAPAPVDPALDALAQPEVLAACVERLSDFPAEPLAVDLATYDGTPAAVVLLPGPEPGVLDVYVVPPDCAAGELLYFERVPQEPGGGAS